MKKEAEHLKRMLKGKYGEAIEFNYVDVGTEEIKGYPEIEGILENFQLPLTVLDGKPLLQGGLSFKKVAEAINQTLNPQ